MYPPWNKQIALKIGRNPQMKGKYLPWPPWLSGETNLKFYRSKTVFPKLSGKKKHDIHNKLTTISLELTMNSWNKNEL